MNEFLSTVIESDQFELPITSIPSGCDKLLLSVSHWEGEPMDLDLQVSYDGGETWVYGGGGKGVISSGDGNMFHFSYHKPPTHIKGMFRSDGKMTSMVSIAAG